MLNLKKTAVAVLAFGSSAAFAGTMGPVCTPGSVTVPCEETAWNLGVQALYLKPYYTDHLAWLGATTDPNNVRRTYHETDAKWAWGFQLEGSYHFHTGNDVTLNWYHLEGRTTTENLAGNFTFFGFANRDRETFTIKPRWDAVNAEFGQDVDFGEYKNIRFHGGAQYARIKTDTRFDGDYVVLTNGVRIAHRSSSSATFNGFGPRVGADMDYDWGNGFSVYAKGAGAVLAGTSKFNRTYSDNAGRLINVANTESGSRTAIVPEMEGKLGATYTYAMAQGDLSLDAGYMWVHYMGAQTFAHFNDIVPHESSFGVQGPYLGLKWVGSVV